MWAPSSAGVYNYRGRGEKVELATPVHGSDVVDAWDLSSYVCQHESNNECVSLTRNA